MSCKSIQEPEACLFCGSRIELISLFTGKDVYYRVIICEGLAFV